VTVSNEVFAGRPNQHLVNARGWQVLRTADVDDTRETRARLLEWIEGFGAATQTVRGVYVWPVSARRVGRGATFSETDERAPMHTDSQFRDEPEDAFALLCLQQASEGGASVLQRADAILDYMRRHHPRELELLRSHSVPFMAPDAFETDGVSWHPVVGPRGLVWRWDTLRRGLRHAAPLSPSLRHALVVFRDLVESLPPTEVALARNEVLVVDNRRCLHGRTAFQGHRLLYRVRFNWK
jgi:alpha-ketoglutarate-dependent taurine dioxygenase